MFLFQSLLIEKRTFKSGPLVCGFVTPWLATIRFAGRSVYTLFIVMGAMCMAQTPMGGMQTGQPQMMSPFGAVPKEHSSKGKTFMDTYGSSQCGEELERVTDSISKFKSMVDKIRSNEKCESVKKTLNNNIPKLSDIQKVATSRGKLQLIRQNERELRDIENRLSELYSSGTATIGQTQALSGRKQQIRVRLASLKREIGEEKHTQQINTHKTVINNIDEYSQALGTAIQNRCLSNSDGTATQALLSLTGLTGLMLSSTPLGLGLSGAVKLTRNLFNDIGEKYSTKGLDKTLMVIGLRCTITVLNQEHCDLIKNKKLVDQVETEGDFCEDCSAGLNTGFGLDISNILEKLSFAEAKDVEDFILEWYDPNTGGVQRIQSLNALSHLVDESLIPKSSPRGFNLSRAKAFLEKIQSTANAFKTLENSYDNNNTTTEKELTQYKQTFMNSLNTLTATDAQTQSQLKHFKKLVDYQGKLIIAKIQKHNQANSDNLVSEEMAQFFKGIRINTVSELFKLSDSTNIKSKLQAIQKKQDNMRLAFDGNFKKMKSFSEIFQNDAEQALEYIENDMDFESGRERAERQKTKSEMCLKLLGLTSPSQKINQECKTSEVKFQGQTFKYEDFVSLPHDERVCAVQDFYQCAEDPSSPACYEHERRKKEGSRRRSLAVAESKPSGGSDSKKDSSGFFGGLFSGEPSQSVRRNNNNDDGR